MYKDPLYPAMMFHPETGEARTFQRPEDVPAGWLDHHPNSPTAPPAPERDPNAMTRDEIKTALDEGGIDYAKNAGTVALENKLREELVETLVDRGEDGEAMHALSTRELLSRVAPPG